MTGVAAAKPRALVTGAGARLGRDMAIYLGSRGFDVAVHYGASRDGAEETAQAIRELGQRAETFQADLLDMDATEALVPAVMAALGGPITCLVNNASLFEYDNLGTATQQSWDRNVGSNLRAPYFLTQKVAEAAPSPLTDDRNEPVAQCLVINMLDQRIRKLTPEYSTYTIGKMGLWALTQTAAQGLAPAVRVNGIAPGPTLKGGRQDADKFAKQRSRTVMQRGSNPEDITRALGYFLDAVSVTGQCLCVDGGQHLGWQTPDIMGVE